MDNLSENDIKKMLTNPYYCLPEISPSLFGEHKPLATEDIFISMGVSLIADIGAEKYLKLLLENLKGNFVENPDSTSFTTDFSDKEPGNSSDDNKEPGIPSTYLNG